jgi:hypothetical protein
MNYYMVKVYSYISGFLIWFRLTPTLPVTSLEEVITLGGVGGVGGGGGGHPQPQQPGEH